jgi:hypothetical protein
MKLAPVVLVEIMAVVLAAARLVEFLETRLAQLALPALSLSNFTHRKRSWNKLTQ